MNCIPLLTILHLVLGKPTRQGVKIFGLLNLLDDANDIGKFDRLHHWQLGSIMCFSSVNERKQHFVNELYNGKEATGYDRL